MTEPSTYQGSCHCGKVMYEVTTDLANAIACNCSMCSRMGSVLTFVPESRFRLLSGEEALSDYQFNKKSIHHRFCSNCGIRSFANGTMPDGEKMVAVNLRCVPEVDLDSLTITHVDGKSF